MKQETYYTQINLKPESAEMFFDSIKPSSIQDWDPDKSIRKQYRFGK